MNLQKMKITNLFNRKKAIPTASNDGKWRTSFITDPTGRRWKVFGSEEGSPPMISQGRFYPAEVAILKAENILTPEDQMKRLDDMLAFHDKGKIGNIIVLIHDWRSRLLMCSATKCLLDIATVYVMFEDENPETYSPNLANEKLKIWAENPEVQFFFANIARLSMPNLSGISSGDFRTALLLAEARTQITEAYISEHLSATN